MPAWLRHRWTLGALALAAFSLVVWFAGDTLVLGASRPLEQPWQRLLLAAIVAISWIGWEARRAKKARSENERLLAVIAGGESGAEAGADSGARAAHEVAVLRERFEKAAAILKTARFQGPDGERRYMHELPWYVIIGAPGSGKTTALVNSGLRFPLPGAGAEPGIAGVGGTRNCDWWFTDEAVLLDTAGRYTTQQSDALADASAWLAFLDLLKRFRPRRPLNGALVTVSLSDLMLWDDEERARYAAHVRERVSELYARLGVRFPVYVLVTKADLLAGFMEFFGELDAEARAQVWGATFDLGSAQGAEGPGSRFGFEFADLERRLYAELMGRLETEGDLQRRAAIYRFPQEFHGAGALVGRFVEAAFGGHESAGMLRGVYFTSGTQEGSPIDRVLGTLARSFKLERAAAVAAGGSGKSFFLAHLVRSVIFPESGLAGSDERIERRQTRLRMGAYAAIAGLAAALGALWTAGYFANQGVIANAEAKTAAARDIVGKSGAIARDEEARLVAALDALRDLPGAQGESGRERLSASFGLSQSGKLDPLGRRAYRNALTEALLPRLAIALEDDLRDKMRNPKARESLEASLAAYVGLYEGKSPDPAPLAAAAGRLWKLPEAAQRSLASHLGSAFGQGAPEMRHPRDEAIIRAARQLLGTGKTS